MANIINKIFKKNRINSFLSMAPSTSFEVIFQNYFVIEKFLPWQQWGKLRELFYFFFKEIILHVFIDQIVALVEKCSRKLII